MPVSAINATPGSATANALVTLAVADQYHLDRPAVGTTWSAATSDQKTTGILWATKLMSTMWRWNGYVTYPGIQVLPFPRYGLYLLDEVTPIDQTTIPTLIQWATAEFARQLLAEDRAGDNAIESLGIKLLKVGTIRLDFKEDVYAKPVPDAVRNMIPCDWGYVVTNSGSWERPIVRA